MSEDKLCPLSCIALFITQLPQNPNPTTYKEQFTENGRCEGDRCAWFDQASSCCAVVLASQR